MRITRLQLRHFGTHRDLDVELAPGFTIIRGPNEAGKSTIQRSIELALFCKPTAATAELEALRSWGAPEDQRSSTRIEFVVDDDAGPNGEGTSRGILEKEFRGQKGRVSLELDGQTYTDPTRVDELIAGLTGVPNDKFFRSTASIRHEDLDNLDRDEDALHDRLQGSIGGGDKGSSRAKTRLEDAIRALKSKGDKNPGRLKIAEEAVARAEQALKNGEAALKKLEQDRDELARARDARLRAETALTESRNMLEGARHADRLRSDRAVIADRFERLRQAAEAQRRLQELEAMPERSMSSLRDQLDRMRTLQSRVSILKETLQGNLGPDVEPDEPEPEYLLAGILTLAMFVATGVSIALGIFKALVPVVAIGLICLCVSVFPAVRFWERRSVAVNVRRINESRERDRALRRQGRVGTEEGLRVAQSGVQNILRELGVPDIASAEKLLTGEQSRRQEIATLQVQVSALAAGQTGGSVAELRDRASLEMEQKTAAIAALGPIANDARAREQLEAEIRERHAALERARDAEAGAIARVDANPVDSEQVAGESERLVTWQGQLAGLRRRVRIYEKTLAAIEASESGTMRKATRFLEQQVGRDIGRLTGGRYKRVSIDDQSLDIRVWAPERGDWVAAYQLSKGTIDQVFLAARIGLVRLVTQGRRPPMVLDDPFVTFDDARASRAALLLRELSSDFQVIYLACTNRYDGLADAIVELPGPSEVEAAAAGPISARASAQAGKAASPAHHEPLVSVSDSPADQARRTSRGLASSLLEEAQASVDEIAGVGRPAGADEASADEASADETAGPIQVAEHVAPVRNDGVEAGTADDTHGEAAGVPEGNTVAGAEEADPGMLDSSSPSYPDPAEKPDSDAVDAEPGEREAKDGR
jgi:DNA repair exonuclease SbcCD ATPase subunit